MSPLVSIIIPVYNTESYLTACLESVCAQTLRDIEIICIDDGSKDGCPAILKGFAERDKRIRVITQENKGRVSARNEGIIASSGDWIGFVDSDDTVTPDMFERLYENGENNRVDISHCGLMFCYPDNHKVPHYGMGTVKYQDHDTALFDLLDGNQIEPSMCCKLYRRELFRDFRIENKIERNEDLFCNFVLFGKASSSLYEDFCGYNYLQRHRVQQTPEALREILSIRHDLIGMSSPSIRNAAYHLWLSTLVNTLNQLSVSKDELAPNFYEECREQLKKEADQLSLLSSKQKFSAKLHLRFPFLVRMIYRIFGKYSLYLYEH